MDVLNIVNTIRDQQDTEYQARIPELSRTNMESFRYAMLSDDNIQQANQFVSSLLNKVIKTHLHSKRFENPLKAFKQGDLPMGDTVEEIYNNFIKATQYDPTGAELLKRHLPDVKTLYHSKNLELQYPITISRKQLKRAFVNERTLESFINDIINTLYNSAELDEFGNTKQLFKSAIDKNAIKIIEIDDPFESKENAEKFIKEVKTVSGMMVFPSTHWNSYTAAQTTDDVPITTFSRLDEQVLILDTATNVSVSVDVLAAAFNMSVVDFNKTKKVVIDVFPSTDTYTIHAALVDKNFFQIYDDLVTISTFQNGKGLYDNYYYNVWQIMAYSILVNAVAFGVKKTA